MRRTFSALVVGVMVGCVAWSLVQLVRVFFPAWNATYLIAGCVLGGLEAFYSHYLLQTPRVRGTGVLRFRLVELGTLFLLLVVGRLVGRGVAGALAAIRAWPDDPGLILGGETIAAFGLVLLCWLAATATARDLDAIGEPPERHKDYVHPLERLRGRFFTGGAVLLVASGLARLGDLSRVTDLSRPPLGGLVLNALIYFLLGFVMLGQVRFVELQKRWQDQKVEVAREVAGRWVRYSLGFIGLAALLAFLLPTGFSEGLLEAVGRYLGIIAAVVAYVGQLLLLLFLVPLGLLTYLLSWLAGQDPSPPQTPSPTFDPPPAAESGGAAPWLQILQALLFTAFLIGGAVYILRSYLRDHPELGQALRDLRLVRALRRAWGAFWRWLRAWSRRVRGAVAERLPLRAPRRSGASRGSRPPFRFFRLGGLSPRERVLYYYLSILRRADKQGLPRRPHQTPREYYDTLEPNLPLAWEEMQALTEAFVEARYSRHEVEKEQDRQVRGHWERVKAALRSLRRRGEQR